MSISAVIITKNNADSLDRTLAALHRVTDDVVVVDSLSTDHSAEIAQKHGARFYPRAWPGYSEQKNFGNQQALHPWVLSLDDDEVLSEDLAEDILELMKQPHSYAAVKLRFHTYFCGKRIRFGAWNPEWHIRLFRKADIAWNTDAVHEGLTVQPHHQILTLEQGVVRHYTVDTVAEFEQKTERYARLFAQRAIAAGKKSTFVKRFLSPTWRFLSEYFLKFGFLDGRYGYVIARENARYTYLKYTLLEKQLCD
jgi:glycosyltransferase involved in cell wall biosynthesis